MKMNAAEDTRIAAQASQPEINLTAPSDRRSDIEAKQALVAEVLREVGCDGLLILRPENFTWLTSGGTVRGILDEESLPGLFFTAEGRWLISSNVDTQRLFDEEIDGLGFQLKEWPWHWGRRQLLQDLCQGRKVACDGSWEDCRPVADRLRHRRICLTDYEIACSRSLGQIVSHALEATGRTLAQGESEREVAGQLAHRLLHRGVTPLGISVAADGRSRPYRQGGFTSAPIQHHAVLTVTGQKYGLCARASRTIAFNPVDPSFRKDHDSACKVSATYVASSWPESVPRQILAGGARIYQIVGADEEWTLCPQGFLTGRLPVESWLTPRVEDLLRNHSALTWQASVGAGTSCDTFLITEDGPRAITAAENWPLKRIRIQGAEFVRPDILVR